MGNEVMNQGSFFDDEFGLFCDMGEESSSDSAVTEGLIPAKEKKEKKVKQEPSGKKEGTGKKRKTQGKTMLQAPVTVVGCSFRYVYEGECEVDAISAAKAAYDAGFWEVALARLYVGKDKTLLYVNSFEAEATDDDQAVPFRDGKITVVIGENRAEYTPADFDGMEETEISILDLAEKFTAAHPAFAGCSLRAEKGIAIPVLERAKEEEKETLSVWRNGSVSEMSKADFHLAFDVSDESVKLVRYRSDDGTIFPSYTGTSVSCSLSDFGVEHAVKKAVEEKYRLPFTICLANLNKNFSVTTEHFQGKASVTQEEVLTVLKRSYRMFAQKDRKIDWVYDKKANLLSVAVVSGKKGVAAVIPFPVFFDVKDGVRIEKTGVGTFKGVLDASGDVRGVSFEMALPKIPIQLLFAIRREFSKDLTKEAMAIIRYHRLKKRYSVFYPKQQVTHTSVSYESHPALYETDVMQIHSHNTMPAFWSEVDDADEDGIGLYGVLGKLHTNTPEIRLRAGMEGAFSPLRLADIFDLGGLAA